MSGSSSTIFTVSAISRGRLLALVGLPVRLRLHAIRQTLRVCSSSEVEGLIESALRLSTEACDLRVRRGGLGWWRRSREGVLDEALLLLATVWDRMAVNQRERARGLAMLGGVRPRWRRAVEAAAVSPDPSARRAAAASIGDFPEGGSCSLLVGRLRDSDASVAGEAEDSLLGLAERALASPGGRLADAEMDRELEQAVCDAARSYAEHRRRGVLEIAALMLTPGRLAPPEGGALRAWFVEEEHETHGVLRAVIRRAADPRVRARCWEWLGGHGVRVSAAALDRVNRASSLAEHDEVLRRTHLLANPARARRVRLACSGGVWRGLVPRAGLVSRLSAEARRGLARLAAQRPGDDDERRALVAVLRADAEPWVHRGAGAGAGREANETERARTRLRVRGAVRAGGAGCVSALRAELSLSEPGRVPGLLALARGMGVADALEPELREIAARDGTDNGRAAAVAVSALGDCTTESAVQFLRACLSHSVVRVRANAVEAMGRIARRGSARGSGLDLSAWNPEVFGVLAGFIADGEHRVRANAIRVLLVASAIEPEADGALAAMLSDARAMHRAAGLWLAERLLRRGDWSGSGGGGQRWNRLAVRVAEVARAETEPGVRERAVRCAAVALGIMRSDWRVRAGGEVA